MSPKYEVVYFNLRGRGELLRLLFHAAGVQFTDRRVEFADWPALKPKTPGGTLPYLIIDSKEFDESQALARYIAFKYNLMGKSDIDHLAADVILSKIDSIRGEVSRARNDKSLTDAQKKEIEGKVQTELLPKLLAKLEAKLGEHKSGYLIGDGLTIADIAVFEVMETPLKEAPHVLDHFPKLAEHRKKIAAYPRISKYLSTRPDTPI